MELIYIIILIYLYLNYSFELLIKIIISFYIFKLNILNIQRSFNLLNNNIIIKSYNNLNKSFLYYRNYILLLPCKYILKLLFIKFKNNTLINVKKLNNKKDINKFINKLKKKYI
jgi:hypothetical protein